MGESISPRPSTHLAAKCKIMPIVHPNRTIVEPKKIFRFSGKLEKIEKKFIFPEKFLLKTIKIIQK